MRYQIRSQYNQIMKEAGTAEGVYRWLIECCTRGKDGRWRHNTTGLICRVYKDGKPFKPMTA